MEHENTKGEKLEQERTETTERAFLFSVASVAYSSGILLRKATKHTNHTNRLYEGVVVSGP
jgi:hypothetical protein